jgi:hypothetical protein
MFSKFITLITVSALAISGTIASPPTSGSRLTRRDQGAYSLNNWGGISTLSNFDDFYGWNNYYGASNSYNYVQGDPVTCHSQQVNIIQQRLALVHEMVKRVISEQICEVEGQALAYSQFYDSMGSYYDDITQSSGRYVGYDSAIVGHYGSLLESDGSLSWCDLQFTGQNIGSQYVKVGGYNWNNVTSPDSVQSAYSATQSAYSATSVYA